MPKPAKKSAPITVRATQPGLYGQIRDVGAVFQISDEQAFSKNWMERVKEGTASAEPEEPSQGDTDAGGSTSVDVI